MSSDCGRPYWQVVVRRTCHICRGSGLSPSTPDGLCNSCNGSGRRPRPVDFSDNYPPFGGEAA